MLYLIVFVSLYRHFWSTSPPFAEDLSNIVKYRCRTIKTNKTTPRSLKTKNCQHRSEERQYCWNCNSRISPRCGRRLSRHLARSVSVPPRRNVHKSVPCIIRSKSMPYREKDTRKMPTNFENSSIKTCFSLSSLHPSTANVEDGQQAAQRPYNSLTKKIKKNETTNQDCWRGDSSYEFLSSLRTSYQYLMDNNLIESCREVGCDLNNSSPIQEWNVERLNIYIKELEKSFCSGSESKPNSCNLTENVLSPKRLSMSEEVRRLNILRHIAQLSKRLPHCREPSLNQSCSSIYNAHYLEVKSNLRSLDQWMAQMEVRLKPNYFRVNWNRREIRQKAEEHKLAVMWAVVHFSFDNSVEAVPSYWLSKDSRLCAWPNNDNLAKKMRANRTAPNKLEFTYYKCRVISKNIESLVDAQLKADKAQYTSDVSDLDNRKKKDKKKYSSVKFAPEKNQKNNNTTFPVSVSKSKNTDESLKKNNDVLNEINEITESHSSEVSSVLDDCDDDYLDKDYLPADQKNINDDENELIVDSDLHFEFDDQLIGLENEEYNFTDVQEATNNEITNKDKTKKIKLSYSNQKELEPNTSAYLNTPSTKNMHPQSNTSAVVSPVSANAGFQKLALNYLASLKIEMAKISDTQQEILTFIQTNNMVGNTSQCPGVMQMDHEVDYFISNWPLSDIDNLLSMEQKIKSDQNFRKQVVCELSRIGGKSLQNMIYKIMKRVFDDGILIQYTYYGLRNKENFSLLAINRAIFDAIKRSKFKNASDDEIITTIGKWLTSAKSRLNKNNVLQI